MTNGDIGHSRIHGPELAARRKAEAEAADSLLGASTRILGIHDGELEPTLENRRKVTEAIRQWKADVVIAHRPNDYHPDHRYVGVLVQDSAYMVTVPFFCPDTPYLADNPVFLYSEDGFQRPTPFRPDVVVAINDVIEKKVEALMKMESQFVEGAPTARSPRTRRSERPSSNERQPGSTGDRSTRPTASATNSSSCTAKTAVRTSAMPRHSRSASTDAGPAPTNCVACSRS